MSDEAEIERLARIARAVGVPEETVERAADDAAAFQRCADEVARVVTSFDLASFRAALSRLDGTT